MNENRDMVCFWYNISDQKQNLRHEIASERLGERAGLKGKMAKLRFLGRRGFFD